MKHWYSYKYHKFHWLKKRYEKLITECERRGFSISNTDSSIFKVGNPYYNGYVPTGKSFKINRERIIERIKAKMYGFFDLFDKIKKEGFRLDKKNPLVIKVKDYKYEIVSGPKKIIDKMLAVLNAV